MMEIDPKALSEKLAGANPPLVVDVREPKEWQAEGVIEGALLMPMNEIPGRLAELPEDREIVAVCHRGMRSLQVAMWLKQMGRNAVSMRGGMDGWKANQLPTVTAR
jgi:rhodanese-related sulfurtransferase